MPGKKCPELMKLKKGAVYARFDRLDQPSHAHFPLLPFFFDRFDEKRSSKVLARPLMPGGPLPL